MESKAAILEQDVQQRREALNDEKTRVDLILNRMMPPEAAELLKEGRSVQPELFEEATVFFSGLFTRPQSIVWKINCRHRVVHRPRIKKHALAGHCC